MSKVFPIKKEKDITGIENILYNEDNFDFIMETMITVMEKRARYNKGGISFTSQDLARKYLLSHYQCRKHETFGVLFLDNRNKLIKFEMLFNGTVNSASVYPRVVAQKALEYNAAALILSHNHPSGSLVVSESDKKITRDLIAIMDLIDVRVLDHFIVGFDDVFSMSQHGYI